MSEINTNHLIKKNMTHITCLFQEECKDLREKMLAGEIERPTVVSTTMTSVCNLQCHGDLLLSYNSIYIFFPLQDLASKSGSFKSEISC